MVLLYCRQLLANCFSLKGLIRAVLVLWQAEHKKVCQTWVPYSQSAQNPHGDELCSKADSSGIHRAECSTNVQAHKQLK